ncbi:hypothetical protein EC988_006488, partial [Linderina pennispora]
NNYGGPQPSHGPHGPQGMPPPSVTGTMSQAGGYTDTQYQSYPQQSYPPMSQAPMQQPYTTQPQAPPPMAPQQSAGNGIPDPSMMSANYPPQTAFSGQSSQAEGPRPPPAGRTSRPVSQYQPPNMNSSRHSAPSQSNRRRSHYGQLVPHEPDKSTACSGAACSACWKYNLMGCCACCNGWLRLCGGGFKISDVNPFSSSK